MAKVIPGGLVGPTPGQYQQQAFQAGMQAAYQGAVLAEQKRQENLRRTWQTIKQLALETPTGTISELFANNPALAFKFFDYLGLDPDTANNLYGQVTNQPLSVDAFEKLLTTSRLKVAIQQALGINPEEADQTAKTVVYKKEQKETQPQRARVEPQPEPQPKKEVPQEQRRISDEDFYTPNVPTPQPQPSGQAMPIYGRGSYAAQEMAGNLNQFLPESNQQSPPNMSPSAIFSRGAFASQQAQVPSTRSEAPSKQQPSPTPSASSSGSFEAVPAPPVSPSVSSASASSVPLSVQIPSDAKDKSIGWLAMQYVFRNHPELNGQMPSYSADNPVWQEWTNYQKQIQTQLGKTPSASWDNEPLAKYGLEGKTFTLGETKPKVSTQEIEKATKNPEKAKTVAKEKFKLKDVPGHVAQRYIKDFAEIEKEIDNFDKMLQSGKKPTPQEAHKAAQKITKFIKQDVRYKDVSKLLSDPTVVSEISRYADIATQDPGLLRSLLLTSPQGQALLLQNAQEIEAMKDPTQRKLAMLKLIGQLAQAIAKIARADADVKVAELKVQQAIKGNKLAELNEKIKLLELGLRQDESFMRTLQAATNLMKSDDKNLQVIGKNIFNGLDKAIHDRYGVHLNAEFKKNPALWNLFGLLAGKKLTVEEQQPQKQQETQTPKYSEAYKQLNKELGF